MFYEYLAKFDLTKFSSFHVIVKIYDEDADDFYEYSNLLAIQTYDFDLLFDLYEIFNNFSYESINHFISGDIIYFKVSIYE